MRRRRAVARVSPARREGAVSDGPTRTRDFQRLSLRARENRLLGESRVFGVGSADENRSRSENRRVASSHTINPNGHRLLGIANGCRRQLSLADHLADGPKSATELAGLTRTHEGSLYRLMRTLASLGILSEDGNRRFALGCLGEALKSGAPGSARATVLALAGGWWWRGWEHFLSCLETGHTGMEKEFGMTVFDYLAQHPQEASYFNEAMIGFHGEEPPAVAAAYDFSSCETVVDVGGGPAIFWPPFSSAIPGHVAFLSTCRTSFETLAPYRPPRLHRSRHTRGNRLFRSDQWAVMRTPLTCHP